MKINGSRPSTLIQRPGFQSIQGVNEKYAPTLLFAENGTRKGTCPVHIPQLCGTSLTLKDQITCSGFQLVPLFFMFSSHLTPVSRTHTIMHPIRVIMFSETCCHFTVLRPGPIPKPTWVLGVIGRNGFLIQNVCRSWCPHKANYLCDGFLMLGLTFKANQIRLECRWLFMIMASDRNIKSYKF